MAAFCSELFPAGERVLCALSGGADSMYLLCRLLETGVPVTCAHYNHQLRETAGIREKKRSGGRFEILTDLTEADASDLGALVELLDPSAGLDAAAVRSAIQTGTAVVIVRRRRGRIVASATIARFSSPTGTHHRIEDVIVDPQLRGRGTGRRLMEYALEHLRKTGASSVELTSRPSRIAANALYRSLGFKPRRTNVYEYRFAQM